MRRIVSAFLLIASALTLGLPSQAQGPPVVLDPVDEQVAVIAGIEVSERCRDRFTDALETIMVPQAQRETGTLTYSLHVERDNPNTIWFYELYRDTAARQAHAQSAARAEFGEQVAGCVTGAEVHEAAVALPVLRRNPGSFGFAPAGARVALVAAIDVDPACQHAFLAALDEIMIPQSASESRTLMYALHTEIGRPNTVWFYEQYRNLAGRQAHARTPARLEFGAAVAGCPTGARVHELDVELPVFQRAG